MATRMQQRRGTAAQWAATNPILADGEIGIEKDTGIVKIGNGASTWTALPRSNSDEAAVTAAITAHKAEADPHPVYLTSTEGTAAFEPKIDRTGSVAGEIPFLLANGTFDLQTPNYETKIDRTGSVPGEMPVLLANGTLDLQTPNFEAKISRDGKLQGQVPVLQADGSLVLTTFAGGGGSGTVDTRTHVNATWQVRGAVPDGVVVFWIKRDASVADPPTGGGYMMEGVDVMLGVSSAPVVAAASTSSGYARTFLHGGF